MLRYIFTSLVIVCTLGTAYSQNEDANLNNQEAKQDTATRNVEKKPYLYKKRGTSLGIDLTRFIIPFVDDGRIAFEASLRTNYKKRAFLVAEAGYENVGFDDKSYEYSSDGVYARVGFDYDIFAPEETGINDNLLIGVRYGFAFQDHEANSYTITDDYWGNYSSSVSRYGVTTHWLEFVGGIRAEVLKNFYLTWLIRVKAKFYSNNKEVLEPYRVPGLGKSSQKVNLDFSYSMEYLIPWGNKKHRTKL